MEELLDYALAISPFCTNEEVLKWVFEVKKFMEETCVE